MDEVDQQTRLARDSAIATVTEIDGTKPPKKSAPRMVRTTKDAIDEGGDKRAEQDLCNATAHEGAQHARAILLGGNGQCNRSE